MRRRELVAGLVVSAAILPSRLLAQATSVSANALDFNVIPDFGSDQSVPLQEAIDRASRNGSPLFLPTGRYIVSGLELPSNFRLYGVAGATILLSPNGETILSARNKTSVTVENLTLDGQLNTAERRGALLEFSGCTELNINHCTMRNSGNNGVYLSRCSGRIEASSFTACAQTGIHLQNSSGMLISGNSISACGNGGIRVWRSESGPDGTLVINNRIDGIGSDQGNGQNGNGINIFRADRVIISGNSMQNCAFSAIRANATNDTIINGNQCFNSSEVAIFSEFAFSGSIISDNIIDGAALGISITNFNDGGRLAICANNIVRNITPFSPTNPNTKPIGIFAEADTAISGNLVENVPGIGISAGWGRFLRNVLVSNNIIRGTRIGIAVSVVAGAGFAKISGNLIVDTEQAALAGLEWRDVVSEDLVRDAARFPHISLHDNSVV